MESDRFGLALSTDSSVAAENYQRFVDRKLASRDGADRFLSGALAADETFALAVVGEAYLNFGRGDIVAARERAAAAAELAAGATVREQGQIAALGAVINGAQNSAELVLGHIEEFPTDALMLFVATFLIGFSGRATWRQEQRALLDSVAPHFDRSEWSILAMGAFVAEEERDLDAARSLAEQSLEACPENARAAHVMAHTYFERALHEEGCAFLAPWLKSHDPESVFAGHLWWHVALHQLGQTDRQGAIDTLRAGIVAADRHPFRINDEASLLWRLDLYGLGADPSDWAAASELAAEVVTRPGNPFVDSHVLLAHAGAEREDRLAAFVAQLESRAAAGDAVAGEVMVPLARGVAAFAQRRFDEASALLAPLVGSDELVRIGGSNAQREIFEDTLIAALIASGGKSGARAVIDRRLSRRPSWVDDGWRALASA
jgi:hypothetical protein